MASQRALWTKRSIRGTFLIVALGAGLHVDRRLDFGVSNRGRIATLGGLGKTDLEVFFAGAVARLATHAFGSFESAFETVLGLAMAGHMTFQACIRGLGVVNPAFGGHFFGSVGS